jgi:hypothetical protein
MNTPAIATVEEIISNATAAAETSVNGDAPEKRGPRTNPETAGRLAHLAARAISEPGVASAVLAKELNITSLLCGQLGDRLVKQEGVLLFKLPNGHRTYYPVGTDMEKVAADAQVAEEAAKVAKAEAAAEAAAVKAAKAAEAAVAKAAKAEAEKTAKLAAEMADAQAAALAAAAQEEADALAADADSVDGDEDLVG